MLSTNKSFVSSNLLSSTFVVIRPRKTHVSWSMVRGSAACAVRDFVSFATYL